MTRGYFLDYNSLPSYVKSSFFRPELQRHKYFDVYAFGVILSKFFPEGSLNGDGMTKGFSEKIKLLMSKCQEPNPADRLAPFEIVIYLDMLIRVWDKMCES